MVKTRSGSSSQWRRRLVSEFRLCSVWCSLCCSHSAGLCAAAGGANSKRSRRRRAQHRQHDVEERPVEDRNPRPQPVHVQRHERTAEMRQRQAGGSRRQNDRERSHEQHQHRAEEQVAPGLVALGGGSRRSATMNPTITRKYDPMMGSGCCRRSATLVMNVLRAKTRGSRLSCYVARGRTASTSAAPSRLQRAESPTGSLALACEGQGGAI